MSKKIKLAKQVDGIEMGVFDDGSTYLTESALAALCGASRPAISKQAAAWATGDRTSKFATFLQSLGYSDNELFLRVTIDGVATLAYPEVVSMALLEYYAFISDRATATAQNNFRVMARATLRIYIYRKTGYDPQNRVPDKWRKFQDRVGLNAVPRGYFSVFKESVSLVVFAIQNGLDVNEHTVPDISIGKIWSNHWASNNLAGTYGDSIPYDHYFPDDFPQAKSNPQNAKAYPVAALGAFRQWIEDVYMPEKFPNYIRNKVKDRMLPASAAELILEKIEEFSQLEAGDSMPRLGPAK